MRKLQRANPALGFAAQFKFPPSIDAVQTIDSASYRAAQPAFPHYYAHD
jgi:hypothetical protein